MYAKNIRSSAKREVQTEWSAKRNERIACPGRAKTREQNELRAMRIGYFFSIFKIRTNRLVENIFTEKISFKVVRLGKLDIRQK